MAVSALGGVADHGQLAGLGDDDHPQYTVRLSGLASARPAASREGRFYRATDTGALTYDTGSTWVDVGSTPSFKRNFLFGGS